VIFVGRIKTTFIKNLAEDLLEKEPSRFSTDYKKNKEIVKQLVDKVEENEKHSCWLHNRSERKRARACILIRQNNSAKWPKETYYSLKE